MEQELVWRRSIGAGDGFGGDERALLQRLLSGDSRAWPEFVDRHADGIYSVLRRTAGLPPDDVDDVFQEVFVRLCKNNFALLRRFEPARARLKTYIFVITKSAAIDHCRRLRKHVPIEEAQKLPTAPPADWAPVYVPEGLLTGRQRLILSLLYDHDLDPAEAARMLDVTPQTIRSAHHKAISRLRRHFRSTDAKSQRDVSNV